jgi:hypothetical protein
MIIVTLSKVIKHVFQTQVFANIMAISPKIRSIL